MRDRILSGMGKWSAEYDEHGNCTKAVYDDAYLHLLGIESEDDAADSGNAWRADIHPDDVAKIEENAAELFAKHPEGMDYDLEYRMMTPSGYRWFHDYGICTRRPDGSVSRMDGVIFDVQDIVDKDEAQNALSENYRRIISAFASENAVSILCNLKNGTFSLLSNEGNIPEKIISLLSCADPNAAYAENFVHPDDREKFCGDLFTIKGVKSRLDIGGSFSFEYRGKIDAGYSWYRVIFNRISEDEVILGYRNCDEEVLNRQLSEKVIADFASVFVVDIDSDTFRFVSRNSESGFADMPGGIYSETIREYITRVNPDYREKWYHVCDPENARELLAKEGRVEYVYPLEGIEKRWRRCILQTLESENGIPISFIMTYLALDDNSAENLELTAKIAEQKEQLEEDVQMIGGLASGYYALYYFNIDDAFFRVYALDGKKLPKAASIVGKGGDPVAVFGQFAMSDLIHPDDRHLFTGLSLDKLRERLAHSKKFTVRFRRNFNGEYRWSEMDVVKYENVNEQANAIAIGFADRDADIRKEQEMIRQLEDAREAADAANRSKSNFLFNMSHDIRTPMNAIRGFTSMAKKNAADEKKVSEYLDKIDISGQQLLTLINQVLEMARIESGKIEFIESPVDVRDEFNRMVTVLSEQAAAKGLTFIHRLGRIEHNNILADESRISSITFNIVGNAMKYTPAGGTVEFDFREISARKPGYATFVLTVADTGIGMSKEYLKELYEPFSRESSSTVSRIQGTGLGLSIVKNTIDLLGGNIEVSSEPGKGTRFDVTIDFRIDENAAQTAEDTDAFSVSFNGRRVLLVEDNEMNREIARDILEEHGLIVEEAEDGDVAVEMVRNDEEGRFDFILMDIQMPRMNGFEATKAIRDLPPDDVHIPIIALSANAFAEDRAASIAAGMDDHVAKPIDIKELLNVMARFI